MLTFPCNPNIPSKNQQTQNTDYPYLRFLQLRANHHLLQEWQSDHRFSKPILSLSLIHIWDRFQGNPVRLQIHD